MQVKVNFRSFWLFNSFELQEYNASIMSNVLQTLKLLLGYTASRIRYHIIQ